MQEDEILFTEFFNQKLKERGLTLKNLSDQTGIAVKHLENFGHGRFERLPSAPYVHGYFMKLAPILGFDPEEWWTRIKSDESVHKAGPKDRMPNNRRFNRIRRGALVWGSVAGVLIAIYFGARFTTIIGEPQLTLTAPSPNVTAVSASILTFQGRVKNGNALSINGTSVPLAEDGSFSTEITLRSGQNIIELKAKKTLGREITLTRQVYYDDTQVIVEGAPLEEGTNPEAF